MSQTKFITAEPPLLAGSIDGLFINQRGSGFLCQKLFLSWEMFFGVFVTPLSSLVGWEVAMKEAIRCLKRIPKRYVILGSFALYQYGFEVDPKDVDVWLDPDLSEQDWRCEVQRVAGRHEVSDHSRDCDGIYMRHLRIECDPHVDVLNVATRLSSTTFDAVYDQSLASRLGRLLPLKTLVFCKSAARRENDYYQCRKIFEELSEVWRSNMKFVPGADDSDDST